MFISLPYPFLLFLLLCEDLKIELRTEQASVDEHRSHPMSISVNAIGSVPAPVILTVSSVPHNKDHYATGGMLYCIAS